MWWISAEQLLSVIMRSRWYGDETNITANFGNNCVISKRRACAEDDAFCFNAENMGVSHQRHDVDRFGAGNALRTCAGAADCRHIPYGLVGLLPRLVAGDRLLAVVGTKLPGLEFKPA